MNKKILENPIIPMALIIGLQILIYWPLILHDPILKWDDQTLLAPLFSLSKLSDYHIFLTPDFQPLRDLSFLIDIFLTNQGLSFFHLHNVLLWAIILHLSYRCLIAMGISHKQALILTLLFSLHPVHTNTISWISARKHLLAGLFLLPCIKMVLEKNITHRQSISIILLFLFSLLSHPIHLFFPIWMIIYLPTKQCINAVNRTTIIACLAIAFSIGIINLYYYQTIYLDHYPQAAEKILPLFKNLHIPFLMIGRYFINLIAPFSLSPLYPIFSKENILGLILCLVWTLTAFYKLHKIKSKHLLLLLLLPLLPTIINITPIFTSDTYLLIPTLFFIGIFYFICPIQSIQQKYLIPVIIFLSILMTGLSIRNVKNWESDIALWKHNYETHHDASSIRRFARILLHSSENYFDVNNIFKIINELNEQPDYLEKKQDLYVLKEMLQNRLFHHEKLDLEEKLLFLKHINQNTYQAYYYIAFLQFQKGENNKAHQNLLKSKELLKKSHYDFLVHPQAIQNLEEKLLTSRWCK